MCGIAGMLARRGPPPSREALARMAGALFHRGPDEFGIYRDGVAGLSHARLSIIDLVTGQQPLSNEDETLWVVFNGEIFNYVELRAELEARGHRFRTKSDTEVIVHAYEEWGDDAFSRFNGQFAIALWDASRRALALVRDRVGVRPLFYLEHADRLFFGSEIKAIFAADPELPRELDPVGLKETFTFWSVVPPQSVFRGVVELPPGTVRTYTADGVREHTFWRPEYRRRDAAPYAGSPADAAAEVRDALEQATRLRMLRADVPVGSYLSGGLDSSLVASLGLRVKGSKFRTFSLRFEDAEYDETAYQRMMREYIGSDHSEVVVSRRDIAEVFPAVVEHAERPILRTAPAPMFLLSRLVRSEGIKVVLTGEGADEMFAGYDLFREAKVRRFWAKQPSSSCRPRLLERLYPYLSRSPTTQQAMARRFFGRRLEDYRLPGFSHEPRWDSTSALQRLFSSEQQAATADVNVTARLLGSLPPEFETWTDLAQDQYLEVRTLLTGYILSAQGDRMLMANSVEGRFPFLDANVMELGNRLPAAFKLAVLDEKHVLKRASNGLVPADIALRKKQPYRAPDALCFAGPDAPDWVAAAMDEGRVRRAGIFDPQAVKQLWAKCRARAADQFSNADNMAVVGILSTHLLHEGFVERRPVAPKPVVLKTVVERLEARP
jgi:asparagine synthase (glutamine-hydrolysing)